MLPSLAALLLLAGCSAYDPAMRGTHAAEQYRTDLEACRTTSAEQVRLHNAATPQRWIASPVFGPSMVRVAIRQCLDSKGYAPSGHEPG